MAKIKVIQSAMSVEEISFKHLTSIYPNDTERAAELSGYVEQVYELNPGLAGKGQLIAVGTIITMPEPTTDAKIIPANRLWN